MATSVVDPPMRRTTMGMNVTSTDTNTPAHTAPNRSISKLRRTRAGCQLGSVTREFSLTVGSRSIAPRSRSAERAPRPVPAASAVPATRPTHRAAEAARRWADRPARAGRGRRDHHAAVRLDADGFRAHACLLLHHEVHDPALVREHPLERDR